MVLVGGIAGSQLLLTRPDLRQFGKRRPNDRLYALRCLVRDFDDVFVRQGVG